MNPSAEIIERIDLLELASEFTTLSRKGYEYRGACPVHQGTGPNFAINPTKKVFHCHTCKAGGTAFDLYMQVQGVNFRTALEQLGSRVGVDVTYERQDDGYSALREAVSWANNYYAENIGRSDHVHRYLGLRNLDLDWCQDLGFGYCNGNQDKFLEAARKDGIGLGALERSGIIYDSGTPRHNNRMTVPIRDIYGDPVAVTGRSFTRDPKWLHSPDTQIWQRSETVFGLEKAKSCDSAILTEGPMDVAALWSIGIIGSVCSLGTSLSDGQASQLSRYFREVNIMYDGDRAGLEASFKSADVMLRHGITPLIALIEDGDPGDKVADGDEDVLLEALDTPADVMDLKVRLMAEAGLHRSAEGRRVALDKGVETVSAAYFQHTKELYAGILADLVGVSADVVLQLAMSGGNKRVYIPSADVTSAEDVVVSFCRSDELKMEAAISAGVTPEEFHSEENKRTFEKIYNHYGTEYETYDGIPLFSEEGWQESLRILSDRALARGKRDTLTRISMEDNEDAKMDMLRSLIRG